MDSIQNIAGLPTRRTNPIFSKETFISFVPKYKDFIDSENGKKETVITELDSTQVVNGKTMISFKKKYFPTSTNTKVLNVNENGNIILGKITEAYYRPAYQFVADIVLMNSNSEDVDVIITVFSGDYGSIHIKSTILANSNKTINVDEVLVNSELNNPVTIQIESEQSVSVLTFNQTIKTNFVAPNGDGAILFEKFYEIADQKILKNVWNSDWEFALSYCIAHYIDMINRETQKSFGLGDIAADSNPRGIRFETTKLNKTISTNDYEHVMLNTQETKFWNSTEFGRVLITLLQTKAIPTMIVVN